MEKNLITVIHVKEDTQIYLNQRYFVIEPPWSCILFHNQRTLQHDFYSALYMYANGNA